MDNITWNEMYNYLIKQENCIVQHEEFKVIDLHKTLQGMNDSIQLYSQNVRMSNKNCLQLKDILHRIYTAHKRNHFTIL